MKEVKIFLFLIIVIILINQVSSLGISPSKVNVNFEPGKTVTYQFKVQVDDPLEELNVYIEGELASIATLDKSEIKGSDSFILTLNFPSEIQTPGTNRLLVVVEQKVDPELSSTIGTRVRVRSPVDISVPYPGRYLILTLDTKDVNVGEEVSFVLDLSNRGKEDLEIKPLIEIYNHEVLETKLEFDKRIISSQENIQLKKSLTEKVLLDGKYKAIAKVDYGNLATAEKEFRVGSLKLNLINYSNEIENGGLKKFKIEVESGWNNKISGAYGQVEIVKNESHIDMIKTSPSDFNPWEIKTLEGYFDTKEYEIGEYEGNITLFYFGEDKGNSSSYEIKINVIEQKKSNLIIYVILVIILLIILIALKFYFKKNGKKK